MRRLERLGGFRDLQSTLAKAKGKDKVLSGVAVRGRERRGGEVEQLKL